MTVHVVIRAPFGLDSFIFTDGKRYCEHSIESVSEAPEYWWNEAHRALREDASVPVNGEYVTYD